MFASVSRCAEPISQPCQLKVKVTGQGHGFEPWISYPLYISYTPGRIFFKLWLYVCFSESMCRTYVVHANSRSRSQVKVMGLSLEFRVRSISPIPLEEFSLNFGHMFASMWQCAELITQLCRHKVKVTVQGHRFEPWVTITVKVTVQGHGFEPWILCPLHISYNSGIIFFKLWSNVYLSETMCRTHSSTMGTQGQGHSSRSRVWALNFVFNRYLLYPWKDFLLILVKCLPQWNDVQNL